MEKFKCFVCGRIIEGIHMQTIKSSWVRNGGFGAIPPEAIVHVCSKKCKEKSKEF